MSESDIPKTTVDVSVTDIDVVCEAFESIGESLEEIADDVEPADVRKDLYNIIDESYGYSEAYDVSIHDTHELFFSFKKASVFGEKVINELYNDVSSIEWVISEYDNDVMQGWVNEEFVGGQIRRKKFNRDVETAMNAFHNDD